MPTSWFDWTQGSWSIGILKWAIELWNGVINGGVDVLTQSPQNLSPGIWTLMQGFNGILKGTGYGLLVLFFLIALFKNTTNLKDFTLQGVFGHFMRFAGAKLAIDYSMEFIGAIISIVLNIVGIFDASGSMIVEGVPLEIERYANSLSIFDVGAQSAVSILSIIAAIVAMICAILFAVCIYGRVFRIYIHIALAPIGLAPLGGDSTPNPGKKFITSFISVCLEAAVIVLAVVICKALMAGPVVDLIGQTATEDVITILGNYVFKCCFCMVLVVTTTFTANRITKEMFGGG